MSTKTPRIEDLRFRALQNALYHTARRRVLENRNRWMNFLIVAGGAATVIQAVERAVPLEGVFGIPWHAILGTIITLIGALQLVFDFSGRARTHEILQRRYYDLLGSIEECVDPDAEVRTKIMGQIARISGEEPPIYRALEALTYNEATDALYGKDAAHERCTVKWCQSITRNHLHWNGADFTGQQRSE